MADVLNFSHPHLRVGFGSVSHATNPSGFGFAQSPFTNSTLANQPVPGPSTRSAKRRYEADDEDEGNAKHTRDDAMDRSPTPERPKRAAPKRARTTPAVLLRAKDEKSGKESTSSSGNDVDVGVLLASLPPQSLLPLLTALLTANPSLKSSILSLIPRPTLNTAQEAIITAAKKLLDAYPFSHNSMFSDGQSAAFGASSAGFGTARSAGFGGSSGFGFARSNPTSTFGQSQNPSQHGGMRDEYVISRLRPHIADFVSACLSYSPYFSYIESSALADLPGAEHARSHASALQSQHKDKSHPSETFLFLHTVTSQMLSQPPLTQSSLVPTILPRLQEEWRAWIDRVDEIVNRQGGMFGQETVRGWERGLDEFAEAKGNGLESMRELRDLWVQKVGWLVGRQPMDQAI